MAQLQVKREKGLTYKVTLNGHYPITGIRRKYSTWLVPQDNDLLEVKNLREVSKVIMGSEVPVSIKR